MGDAQESLFYMKYKKAENQLYIYADDSTSRHISCTLQLDYDTVCGADKFGNIFIARLPSEISAQVGCLVWTESISHRQSLLGSCSTWLAWMVRQQDAVRRQWQTAHYLSASQIAQAVAAHLLLLRMVSFACPVASSIQEVTCRWRLNQGRRLTMTAAACSPVSMALFAKQVMAAAQDGPHWQQAAAL